MKLLIDLNKYRDCTQRGCDQTVPDAVLNENPNKNGRKTIRELAVFAYSCRRCKDAPCIRVCPEEALKKDENGMVMRSTNLCVACKSCVSICPFGTMMTDFFRYKGNTDDHYNLNDPQERELFVRESPEGAVILTDQEKDEDKNIYELLPGILIKDNSWGEIKNLE
ncbi:MAG: 4Fe-4S dicluster domain-containing protein [Bacteroidota bacterium]